MSMASFARMRLMEAEKLKAEEEAAAGKAVKPKPALPKPEGQGKLPIEDITASDDSTNKSQPPSARKPRVAKAKG